MVRNAPAGWPFSATLCLLYHCTYALYSVRWNLQAADVASLALDAKLWLAILGSSETCAVLLAGGPYYAPRSVRSAALEVLDALFPMGRRSRRLVRLVFRILHPAEILGVVFFVLLLPVRVWSWCSRKTLGVVGWMVMGVLRLFGLLRLLGWHGWG
jgi:hypothetical protein